jgi:hypothetical protein
VEGNSANFAVPEFSKVRGYNLPSDVGYMRALTSLADSSAA